MKNRNKNVLNSLFEKKGAGQAILNKRSNWLTNLTNIFRFTGYLFIVKKANSHTYLHIMNNYFHLTTRRGKIL